MERIELVIDLDPHDLEDAAVERVREALERETKLAGAAMIRSELSRRSHDRYREERVRKQAMR